MADRGFRCYTRKSPDKQYYAICLDLNLADKRETIDQAIAALDESILLYLESVRAHGDEDAAIPRPSPFSEWLEYYGLLFANAFFSLLGGRMEGFLAYTKQEVLTSAQEMRLAYA